MDRLAGNGADAILVACTELSLLAAEGAFSTNDSERMVLDASEIWACHVVRLASESTLTGRQALDAERV